MKTDARFVVYILIGTFASYVAAGVVFANLVSTNLNPAPWEMLAMVLVALLIFFMGPTAGLVCAIQDENRRKRKQKKLREASEESENPYPPI
jgi:hypothetical protein